MDWCFDNRPYDLILPGLCMPDFESSHIGLIISWANNYIAIEVANQKLGPSPACKPKLQQAGIYYLVIQFRHVLAVNRNMHYNIFAHLSLFSPWIFANKSTFQSEALDLKPQLISHQICKFPNFNLSHQPTSLGPRLQSSIKKVYHF